MVQKISKRVIDSVFDYTETKAFQLVAGILILFFLLFFAVRIGGIFAVAPDTWGTMESNVIYGVQRLLAGINLYADPELPPFAVIQYSPVYYYVVYGICKLAGLQATDLIEIYQVSRIVSLLFNLCFGFFTGVIVYRILKSGKLVSLLAGMVAFMILQPHGFSRPDSLFNATIISTVFFYMWYIENSISGKKTFLPLVITGFSIALCLFSKQSGIILLALLGFYQVFILKKFKELFLLLIYTLGFGAIFYLLFGGDDPELFYKNAVRGLDNGISPIWFWYHIVVSYFGSVTGVVFTIAGLYGALFLIRKNDLRFAFLGWSILALFSFATVTGLKQGSTPSYYTEVCALTIVSFLSFKSYIRIPGFVQVTGILIIFTAVFMKPKVLGPLNNLNRYAKENFLKEKAVEEYIRKHLSLKEDEWIFIDLNAWEHFLPGIFYANGLFPQKDIVSQKVSFDYSLFSELKNEGKIKAVISQNDHVEYLGVSFDEFKLAENINGFQILLPED